MTEDIKGKIISVPSPAPRGLNREERRAMKLNAVDRLKKAKTFVLVTFDGSPNRIPSYCFEMAGLKNLEDIRHVFMQECARFVAMRYELMRAAIEKTTAEIKQNDKVKESKDQRSEELQKVEAAA